MTAFDPQPFLANDRVALRPLAADDWKALYAVASDPLVWAVHPAPDRWQEPVFRAFFDAALASGGALAVTDRASGAIIGSSRYDTSRAGPGEIEIGWTFLARAHWGGGTNRAMKRLMVGHALHHFDRVLFFVGENNFRSRRAMEKIGGRLTDRTLATTGDINALHVVYAIDREGFENGPLMKASSTRSG